jgi:hypothetical protein
MKKIFTLFTGLLMAAVVMAADRGPDLTIRNSRNFKIVIDGRAFYSNSTFLKVNNLSRGHHRIEIFETRRSYFGQRERLVNSTSFKMGKDDVRINVDNSGRIQIMRIDDDRYGRDWNNNGRYDDRNGRIEERNDRDGRYDRRDDDNRRY